MSWSLKWGYTYVRLGPAAACTRSRDHSLATFERQHARAVALAGTTFRLYQVHSATLGFRRLENGLLHEALHRAGVTSVSRLGITTSGPPRPTPSGARWRSAAEATALRRRAGDLNLLEDVREPRAEPKAARRGGR